MKPSTLLALTVPCLLSAAASAQSAMPVPPVGAEPLPRYAVVELGLAPPSFPTGMNETGQVTGSYFAAGGVRRAFLWTMGAVSDLGTLGGITQSFAIDDRGVVVGYSVNSQNFERAIRVENGVMVDLGTLHGGNFAVAHDINGTGWIAGMSQARHGNDRYQRAALWRNGTILDLGTFGGEYSEARAINDAGQVVGWAWYPLPSRAQHAFLWSDATGMVDLGTLGGKNSAAADVNDRGVVVGSSDVQFGSSARHAFVWTPQTGMLDLGVPAGTNESTATALNNAGQVVGYSFLQVEFRAEPLLWDSRGLHLLNDLIDRTSGWTLIQPHDINDRGEIAATARRPNMSYQPVLLVPIGGR